MIVSNHLGPASTCGSMGIDQCLRIDLEMCLWLGMHIAGWIGGMDPSALPQQDSATFVRIRCTGFGPDLCDHSACHHQLHRPLT